jgi:hypothetical protein
MKYKIFELDPTNVTDRVKEYKLAVMKDGTVKSFAPWDVHKLDDYDVRRLYIFEVNQQNVKIVDEIPKHYITEYIICQPDGTHTIGYFVDSGRFVIHIPKKNL